MVLATETQLSENTNTATLKTSRGYKMTEFGLIPEDWSVCQLKDLIKDLEAGVSVNSIEESLHLRTHSFSILKTSAVSNGAFFSQECKKIHPKDIYRAKLNPRAEAIIISRMNTPDLVGECCYVQKDHPHLFLPDRLWMTNFHKGVDVNAQWLNFLLNSVRFKKKIKASATGTSGSMKNISKEVLLGILIPYPNSNEQKKIAAALSDIDSMITSLDQLIAKKQNIKLAAMQELLTGKQRLPGFKGEWLQKNVSELGEVITGGTPPTNLRECWEGTIAWITPTDIQEKRDIYFGERKITLFGLSYLRKLPPNTILITCIASIGKNAILRNTGACNQQINALIPNSSYHPEFLYYLFENNKQKLMAKAGITATNIVSKRDFLELIFFLPHINEQTAIAEILSDMDAEVSTLEQQLTKARNLKQGMMQELLTGRIRLP